VSFSIVASRSAISCSSVRCSTSTPALCDAKIGNVTERPARHPRMKSGLESCVSAAVGVTSGVRSASARRSRARWASSCRSITAIAVLRPMRSGGTLTGMPLPSSSGVESDGAVVAG
jgi:hypothetical protein